MSTISQQDVEALLELFERSGWREMRVVGLGLDLFVSKDPDARMTGPVVTVHRTASSETVAAPTPKVDSGSRVAAADTIGTLHVTANTHERSVPVRAPCLGTFYRSPKPGAPPFVSVGERVTADTEVCIVEVMKLFTTVRAGVSGIVREVLVNDAELVEFDQPLLLIEPDV